MLVDNDGDVVFANLKRVSSGYIGVAKNQGLN
jgi:hypothetical protein